MKQQTRQHDSVPDVPMSGHEHTQVWDPLVRTFHWTLAASVLIAFVTDDDFMDVHVLAGYTALALIAVRLIWGLIGPRHARWSDFIKSPGEIAVYLRDAVALRARRHLGHNPAAGAMIVALLMCIVITAITGLALYGAEESAGPLAGLMSSAPDGVAHMLEDVHEFAANFTLLLIALHLAGVAFTSLVHRENLVKSMFTGKKRSGT